jgi:hypothetical protein
MEKLKFGDTAQLETGEEYICLSQMEKNNIDYVYLMSNFKPLKIKFAKQRIVNGNLELEIIGNQEEKEQVLKLFQDKIGTFKN